MRGLIYGVLILAIVSFCTFHFASNDVDATGSVPNQIDTDDSLTKNLEGAKAAEIDKSTVQHKADNPEAVIKQKSLDKLFGPVPKIKITFRSGRPPKKLSYTIGTGIGENGEIYLELANPRWYPPNRACELLGITDQKNIDQLSQLWNEYQEKTSERRVELSVQAIDLYNKGLAFESFPQSSEFRNAQIQHDSDSENMRSAFINRATNFDHEEEAMRMVIDGFGMNDFWGEAFQK